MTVEDITQPSNPVGSSGISETVDAESLEGWRGWKAIKPESNITEKLWAGSSLLPALQFATSVGASDVHLGENMHPWVRRGGRFEPVTQLPVTTVEEMRRVAQLFQYLAEDENELSVPLMTDNQRWRFLVMSTHRGWAATLRVIRSEPPVVEQLGLPIETTKLASHHNGLIIVAGGTGSGKSTTVAALVNRLIQTRNVHVLTIENPVEYEFETGSSLVRQQQVAEEDLVQALAMALRSDPDVVFFGECIRQEHFQGCLQLAATGHLVFTTVHARDAMTVCERIVAACGVEGRSMLANTLRGIISQQLLPLAADTSKRHLVAEVAVMNRATRNQIAPDGNLKGLRQEIQTANKDLDYVLASLAAAGKINVTDAIDAAIELERFRDCAARFGLVIDDDSRR